MTGRQAERYEGHSGRFGALALGLLLLAAVGGLAWVYMGMTTHNRWPIRWLEVSGEFERISAEQVRTRVTPLVEGSYFTVDLEAARAAVEDLPWVAQASVRKRWPDGVEVRVLEYLPVAHWTEGRLLAADGRPFAVPGADGMQGLPWLDGPQGSLDTVIGAWQSFNEELQDIGLEVQRIRLDPRGAWRLQLNNGTRVQLGRHDAMPRLDRMVTGWDELMRLESGVPVGVDLRYANGFAVQWPERPPETDLADNRG